MPRDSSSARPGPAPGTAGAAPAPALPVRGSAPGAGGAHTSRVRPYTLTGGRTRSGHVLLVETLIATIDAPEERRELGSGGFHDRGMPEMRAIVELCRAMRSVAEVSAILHIPLGVVRVLLSDLADQGRIRVHGTDHGDGPPDRVLLERVLSGLRRL